MFLEVPVRRARNDLHPDFSQRRRNRRVADADGVHHRELGRIVRAGRIGDETDLKAIDGNGSHHDARHPGDGVGLVDEVVPAAILLEVAKSFSTRGKRHGGDRTKFYIEGNTITRSLIFSRARKAVLHQTHGHYPAPLKAIEAKDVQALFDVGEAIDEACEHCHRHYWYPPDVGKRK